MVCASPYGLTGPYRDYQGSAFTAFHVGGMGRETPYNEITDSEAFPPLVDGGDQGDYLTGWTAAIMALIAVFHRSTYGTGSAARRVGDGVGSGDDAHADREHRVRTGAEDLA